MAVRGKALGSAHGSLRAGENQVLQHFISMAASLQRGTQDPRVGSRLVATSRTISSSIWTCFTCILQPVGPNFPLSWMRQELCLLPGMKSEEFVLSSS